MTSPRIVTFYSYKGGAGRTMALANVAWILASNGRRVLTIDWDLEAPGLHQYFRPFLQDPDLLSTPGLIDYFVEFAASSAAGITVSHKSILHHASSLDYEFPGSGTIDVVGAGCLDSTYALRVNGFSWQNFYERLGGSTLLERLKQDVTEYDFVLIDSRTGISDYGGICTATMPDTLVVCFTMNSQSLQGSAGVVESVLRQRTAMPLKVFPVPMRVEYGEKELLERARMTARERFAKLSAARDVDYWGRVEFPYIPFYAFHEMLAAFADQPYTTASILSAALSLTDYLTDGSVTSTVEVPMQTRDAMRRVYAAYSATHRRPAGAS